jgi:hypothetical protein
MSISDKDMDRIAKEVHSEPKTFKEAFAKNRKAGKKTFTYKGKKYTTDLKKAPKGNTADSIISGFENFWFEKRENNL